MATETLDQIGPKVTDFPMSYPNPSPELAAALMDKLSKSPAFYLECVTYDNEGWPYEADKFHPYTDAREDGRRVFRALELMTGEKAREAIVGLVDDKPSKN